MTTQEFFQIIASHLTDSGVLTINSASVPGDRRLINGLATTMASVFPSIYMVDVPGSLNTIIFATKQETQPENFAANLLALSNDSNVNPLLIHTMQGTFSGLKTDYETKPSSPMTTLPSNGSSTTWLRSSPCSLSSLFT